MLEIEGEDDLIFRYVIEEDGSKKPISGTTTEESMEKVVEYLRKKYPDARFMYVEMVNV